MGFFSFVASVLLLANKERRERGVSSCGASVMSGLLLCLGFFSFGPSVLFVSEQRKNRAGVSSCGASVTSGLLLCLGLFFFGPSVLLFAKKRIERAFRLAVRLLRLGFCSVWASCLSVLLFFLGQTKKE